MPTESEIEYDERGFDENGIHRDTGTEYGPDGFNSEGYDENGYDSDGWNEDNLHRDTDTEFHPSTDRTRDGAYYDSEGYDVHGRDEDGYDRDGYDGDGYDRDGTDSGGCTRCENGDCDDPDCSCKNSDFEGHLGSYGDKAVDELDWSCKPGDRTLYAGHELEMYSDDVDTDDVDYVLGQLNAAYRKHDPMTSTRKCAIAKYDGSLEVEDGGFEVSTVPLTREQTYAVFESFKTLGDGRCSAWDKGDDIGHHIHLSKSAIGPLTLGKLGVFMNCPENRVFLETIACRTADFNSFENKKKLTQTHNRERHSVLNVTDETVEFRLFKCNLYSRAILKNYEFAVAAVRFCEQSGHGFGDTIEPTSPLHWTQFRAYVAANRREYRYLHEFMLAHPVLGVGYRNNSGLPQNVARPKERSPKFALLRTTSVVGA